MINLELPDLPYSKDALAPYMSAETLELHHDKHHMAYVTNGNKFIKENNFDENTIEEIIKNSFNKNAPVFNNVSQHLNHMHFWEIMQNNPNGKIPSELENKINEDFGSVDSMKEEFINAGEVSEDFMEMDFRDETNQESRDMYVIVNMINGMLNRYYGIPHGLHQTMDSAYVKIKEMILINEQANHELAEYVFEPEDTDYKPEDPDDID